MSNVRSAPGYGLTTDIGRPSQPSGVSGIEIQPDVALSQRGQHILNAFKARKLVSIAFDIASDNLLSLLRVGTIGIGQVGDQVGQGIGLNNSDDTDIGNLCMKKQISQPSILLSHTHHSG